MAGRWIRVSFAFLLAVLSLGGGDASAQSQRENEWAATGARTCDDNTAIVRWIGDTITHIEFSATNTSLNWTTGWQPVSDVTSGYHSEPVAQTYDKLMVRASFADGTTNEVSIETGNCADEAPEPEIYYVDPDKLINLNGHVVTSNYEQLGGATVCILETSECVTSRSDGGFDFYGLPQTTYTVTATLDGYAGEPTVIDVSGADATSINVFLDPIGEGAPTPSVPVTPAPVTPGGGGPEPQDGSYYDPATGNRFEFVTADRMCEDNSFTTTFGGDNLTDVQFMVYSPANGWGGTEWLPADAGSGSFSTEVEQDTAYKVDAAVTFTNGDVQVITTDLADCTAEQSGTPTPSIGDSTLTIQLNLPGGENVEGAPWDLYAPQAAAQVSLLPYTSGVVGANNMIEIPGLIAGEYRIVVSPAGMAPIDATVTVSDQPVTAATLNVNADGTVTVAYAAQVAPTATAAPTTAPIQAAGSGSGTTGQSGAAVSGLPETGAGASSSAAASAILVLATVAIVLAAGSLMIRRKSA